MKCKNHTSSDAAARGVCAVCLRDRLLAVLAAQTAAASSPEHYRQAPASSSSSDSRFFHTPQVGDRVGCRRFSLLSSLFHHHHHRESESSRRKEEKKATDLKSVRVSDRGMSPVRNGDDSEEESVYTTDSSSATWQQRATPARQRRRRQFIGGLAGLGVCLSPLMMPAVGPARTQSADLVGFSGEIRSGVNPVCSSHKRHVAGGGSLSFGPNRSRKLADRSRFR